MNDLYEREELLRQERQNLQHREDLASREARSLSFFEELLNTEKNHILDRERIVEMERNSFIKQQDEVFLNKVADCYEKLADLKTLYYTNQINLSQFKKILSTYVDSLESRPEYRRNSGALTNLFEAAVQFLEEEAPSQTNNVTQETDNPTKPKK